MFNSKVKRREKAESRKIDNNKLQLRLDCSKTLLLMKESKFILLFTKMISEDDQNIIW